MDPDHQLHLEDQPDPFDPEYLAVLEDPEHLVIRLDPFVLEYLVVLEDLAFPVDLKHQ